MKQQLLLVLTACILALPSHAQTFKVLKVKGNKAVIQLPKGITLDKGGKYSIDAADTAAEDPIADTQGRSRVAGGSLDLFAGSTSVKSSTGSSSASGMELSTDLKFGWSDGKMEYGPLLILGYEKGDDYSNRTIAVGGFFDYNFGINDSAATTVYGAGGRLRVGQVSAETSFAGTTNSSSTSLLSFGAGPFAKWFVFGHATCVRGDLLLDYTNLKGDSTTTSSVGVRALFGIETYF